MSTTVRAWLPWGIGAALVLAGLAVAFRPQPVPVDTAPISTGPVAVTVSGTGEARVRDVYTISAPVEGRLGRIEIHAGDTVFANDTIVARIYEADPTPLDARTRATRQAAVKAAEASLALARAEGDRAAIELEFARSQLERSRELSSRGAVSAAALDRAQTEMQSRQAAHATAIAMVQVRLAELDQARAALIQPADDPVLRGRAGCCVEVRSPVSGQVLRVVQESERVVQPGTPLLEIGAPDDLEIVVDLLSTDAVRLVPGARATIRNWGRPGEIEGKVRRIEPYAFTKVSALGVEEQRVNVRIDIDAASATAEGLAHGYRVEAAISVAEVEGALRVPVSALFRNQGAWSVFAVEDGRAHIRTLKIGHMNDEFGEVLSGLAAGARVIIYPSDRIGEDSLVADRG
ncbi:MAG: HlyD family efflux transporter periplasmic adaptor subunit [Rhodobiaceae bacterium]|nr:HlyD family efflux transporter periplasmic adaptor subunit [Rhodobiaceae bacterium]